MIEVNMGARFVILERDKFTCQYCGRSAPDVKLEIDHIIPVSKGGSNESTNLLTCCKECNIGKSNMNIKPIKKPSHVDLPQGHAFTSYRGRSIRMSEDTWVALKKERISYRMSWNKFILKKIEEMKNNES